MVERRLIKNPTLLVSNPPQHQPDFEVAAPVFWLSAIEVRMKANYNIPEIWFADEDEDAITATADYLKQTGFRICVLQGRDIASMPNQQSVQSFRFDDSRLILSLGHAEIELVYDSPVSLVLCQPQAMDQGGPDAEMLEHTPFLDIFASREGQVSRATVFQKVASFSGLPTAPTSESDNLTMLVAELEDRFTQTHVDKRLVGMRLRDKPNFPTAPGQDPDRRRKRYSYATTELAKLLESLSEELTDISQPDLSSRLVYLTAR